eukprot:59579-Prorocentrum_minimum.AAC.2
MNNLSRGWCERCRPPRPRFPGSWPSQRVPTTVIPATSGTPFPHSPTLSAGERPPSWRQRIGRGAWRCRPRGAGSGTQPTARPAARAGPSCRAAIGRGPPRWPGRRGQARAPARQGGSVQASAVPPALAKSSPRLRRWQSPAQASPRARHQASRRLVP